MQLMRAGQDRVSLLHPRSGDGKTVASSATPYRVWVDDPAQFTTDRIATLHHNFHDHPLMQLPQLAQLARELMASGQCRFMIRGASETSAFESVLKARSPDRREVDEVFRHIEEPGSWVALYNVETNPSYRAFLADVMSSAQSLLERKQPGIFKVSGYTFISAPPSVTPFHIDRENNFWLQVRGQKTISVWDHTDRDVVAAKDVEEFVLFGSLEHVRLEEAVRNRRHEFHAEPGDGVYFPSTSPHMTRCDTAWVKPGDGVCISMAIVFYTEVTLRHARVHQVNHLLRRLGITPRSPGQSALSDAVKAPFGHLAGKVRELRRGTDTLRPLPPGSY